MPAKPPAMNEDIINAIPELEQDLPPDNFIVQNFWEPVIWCLGAGILLALLILWLVMRHRKRPLPPPPSPQELAFRSLDELAAELPPLRECSLRLSMVLRTFLTGQVQDPALFETHEEFSRRMDALSTVPTSCQYETRYLLERLADLKYAGTAEQAPQKARVLIEEARGVISNITRAQAQEAAAAAAVEKVKKLS